MSRYTYIFIAICSLSIIVFSTCKTSKKAIDKNDVSVLKVSESDKQYLDSISITYLPKVDTNTSITINLVGDLMCHLPQTNNAKLSNGEYDFNPSFEYIKPYLQDADITVGNLETTFAGTTSPYSGYPAFNSPDAYCTALKYAGFDFLVTANNHSMDTKESGLLRTIHIVKQHQLGYTGTYLTQQDHDSVRILNIKGIKLAILNYTYGTNGLYPINDHSYMLNLIDSVAVVNSIKIAKIKGADIVLVFYHMGTENIIEPTQAQKEAVNIALDAGANIVIGSHPHMVGPTQFVFSKSINDSAFIAYSLGNFLSNQYWRYTDAGVILKLKIQKNHVNNATSVKEVSYLPTWVYRGDGAKKMHIILPAHLALDSVKLPYFLNNSHRLKMIEAFNDTKQIFTKHNYKLTLINLK